MPRDIGDNKSSDEAILRHITEEGKVAKIVQDKFKFNMDNMPFKPHIKSGFDNLDDLLGGGFTPGWVVLGAISNLGKSTFALQLACNIANNGTPVLFFSMEMDSDWLTAKCISRQSFINASKNEDDAVSAKDLMNKESFEKLLKKSNNRINTCIDTYRNNKEEQEHNLNKLYIIDAKDSFYSDNGVLLTAEEISKIVKAFIAEHCVRNEKNQKPDPKPFVIVDYLQIIPCSDRNASPADNSVIDRNIRTLTTIDKDITVLTISSFNRQSYNEKNEKKPLSFDAFKGSGGIEYSADVILGLQFSAVHNKNNNFNLNEEKSKNPRKVELVALKQRYSASGSGEVVRFDYYPAYDYFDEISDQSKNTGEKFESKLSNIELMSAKADKGCKNEEGTQDKDDHADDSVRSNVLSDRQETDVHLLADIDEEIKNKLEKCTTIKELNSVIKECQEKYSSANGDKGEIIRILNDYQMEYRNKIKNSQKRRSNQSKT